jgi:hypothetical protein
MNKHVIITSCALGAVIVSSAPASGDAGSAVSGALGGVASGLQGAASGEGGAAGGGTSSPASRSAPANVAGLEQSVTAGVQQSERDVRLLPTCR